MARKNNLKIRRKKNDFVLERAKAQEAKLEQKKQHREEVRKERMDLDSEDSPQKRQLKRKAQRRLENAMQKLARRGIRLVKVEEDDMDDSERKNTKRARKSSD